MTFLDFSQLLEASPASFVAMSTFDFNADFFEHRLLRTATLAKARRIVVFMDSGQWNKLLRAEPPARLLNRRYLVVPVRTSPGVFHPKLHLFVRDGGGQVVCGSNNLTRAGCTSNLELLNSFTVGGDGDTPESLRLARDAFGFFRKACEGAHAEPARVASDWLRELAAETPWLLENDTQAAVSAIQLLHTYEGSIWDRLVAEVGDDSPRKCLIISPFYDRDAALVQRWHKTWPKCEIEIVAQHKTSNLPAQRLKDCGPHVRLSVLQAPSRRLHAKLIAWETRRGTGCLIGSANFTTAALDGRNVETCLLVRDAGSSIKNLFGEEVRTQPTEFDDFDAGQDEEPAKEEPVEGSLWLESAVLSSERLLRVTYGHSLEPSPSSLRLHIWAIGEDRERKSLPLPRQKHGTHSVELPEDIIRGCHVAMLASLVAVSGEDKRESTPAWIVQEGHLTHESAGEIRSSNTSIIQETGAGLQAELDRIGEQDGVAAMIEYLRQLNVRFDAGGRKGRGLGALSLRRRDPFRPDAVPIWKQKETADTASLRKAIYECVDRHTKKVLLRHARVGNINGMANFVDVFKMIVEMLYTRHMEGLVEWGRIIGYLVDQVQIAVHGVETEKNIGDGFLFSIYDNIGDPDTIQEACDEEQFLAHVCAAFMILQRIRFVPNETSQYGRAATRPRECFDRQLKRLCAAIDELGLALPTSDEVCGVLRDFRMFSEDELREMAKENPF